MKTIYWVTATIILVIAAVLFMNGCFDKKNIIKQLTTGIEHRDDTTTHWRDIYNQEHAKAVSLQEDINTANVLHKEELDDAKKRLNLKDNQIDNLTKVVARLRQTVTVTVNTTPRGDTTASARHKDEFTEINTFTVDDKETIALNIYVPIRLIQYWERPKKFLGIKYGDPVNYIDGTTRNPNVTLDSLTNVRISPKQPGRWGTGPCGGAGFAGNNFTWFLGWSVHYSLFRW